MIIGIDASRANRKKKTGTEWYSWHLIEEFKKMTSSNVIPSEVEGSLAFFGLDLSKEIKFILYTNRKLKGELGRVPKNFQEKNLSWPPQYLWTQLRLWWELLLNPPDVLFVPAHTIPFLALRRKIKVAVTVHDVGFKRDPSLYKPIQVWYHDLTMKKIKRRADIIITDSQFSKDEIIGLYKVDPKKIRVVYLGYDADNFFPATVVARESSRLNRLDDRGNPLAETRDPHASSPNGDSVRDDNIDQNDVLQKYNIAKPYLLYIGRIEKKKNIGNLVKAFTLAKDRHPDLKLILVGNVGNEFEDIKKIIADHQLEREIIFPGYVSERDLPLIIKSASIFMFPTLYEGFGLPILEAMACGTPVVTSAMRPHSEVGGQAVAYADPRQAEQIALNIDKILLDVGYREQLIRNGLERAKEFSWKKTAQQILDVLINI